MRTVPLWLLGASGLALVGTAHGQEPTVRVRAETRIEVRALADGDAIVVEGALRDDVGQPLADRRLIVRLSPEGDAPLVTYVETRADGTFQARVRTRAITGHLEVTFDGDPHHAVARANRAFDPARYDVGLLLRLPDGPTLSLDRSTHRLDVSARSDAGASGLALEVLDELERKLAVGMTDERGAAVFRLPSEHLGPPGPGRLRVRARGDERRHDAQTELPIVRTRATMIRFEGDTFARSGETFSVRGTLRDRAGALAERAVGVFDGETHLGSALTDAEGKYSLTIEVPRARAQAYRLEARFDSDNPGRLGVRSGVRIVDVEQPSASATLWIVLCTLALFASAAIVRWLPGRARRPAARPAAPPRFELGEAGSAVASLRTLRGEVLDARDDRPIADAMVSLVDRAGAARALALGTKARFESGALPDGPYRLRVEARGYSPAELAVEVPHRGELDSVRVRLESLRARASTAIGEALRRLTRAPRDVRAATDRELLAGVPPPPPIELPSLVARVERIVYDAASPTVDEVEAVEHASRRLGGDP